jgi:hypothetical protein
VRRDTCDLSRVIDDIAANPEFWAGAPTMAAPIAADDGGELEIFGSSADRKPRAIQMETLAKQPLFSEYDYLIGEYTLLRVSHRLTPDQAISYCRQAAFQDPNSRTYVCREGSRPEVSHSLPVGLRPSSATTAGSCMDIARRFSSRQRAGTPRIAMPSATATVSLQPRRRSIVRAAGRPGAAASHSR